MFRTQGCARHSHPEVSFVFAEPVPVPGLEKFLLDYFERQVAGGTRFLAGQKIDFGGSLMRLFDRGDGTIGVRDVAADGTDASPESVHRSLMRGWLRQEVARSFGLDVSFPATDATAIACTKVPSSTHALMLKRLTPTPTSPDSGWFVGCTDEAHDHDAAENLLLTYVVMLGEKYPWLDQFFGLPIRTDLAVEMRARVAVPVLWHGDDPNPIPARAGSYVASLNAAAKG